MTTQTTQHRLIKAPDDNITETTTQETLTDLYTDNNPENPLPQNPNTIPDAAQQKLPEPPPEGQDLQQENQTLIHELQRYKQELESLQGLYAEQQKKQVLFDLQNQDSQRFLQVLIALINSNKLSGFFPKSISYGVITADWEKVRTHSGEKEPFLSYTAYHSSDFVNLSKHYGFENTELINTECPRNSVFRSVMSKAIQEPSTEQYVPFEKNLKTKISHISFRLSGVIIRNKYSHVIGMLFALTPKNTEQNIDSYLQQNKNLKKHIHSISQRSQTFDSLAKKLINSTFKALQDTIEDIHWKSQIIHQLIEQIRLSAKRTKVLSFNVSIESVRSSTQGKAPTLISNEIRELTDRIQSQIIQLEDTIKKVFTEIEELQAFKTDLLEYTEHYTQLEKNQMKSHEELDTLLNDLLSCRLSLRREGY